jgi:hypothetical protein
MTVSSSGKTIIRAYSSQYLLGQKTQAQCGYWVVATTGVSPAVMYTNTLKRLRPKDHLLLTFSWPATPIMPWALRATPMIFSPHVQPLKCFFKSMNAVNTAGKEHSATSSCDAAAGHSSLFVITVNISCLNPHNTGTHSPSSSSHRKKSLLLQHPWPHTVLPS